MSRENTERVIAIHGQRLQKLKEKLDLSTSELLHLQLPGETLPLSREREQVLLKVLAQVCQVSPAALQVLASRSEGGWLGLALPKAAAEQLVSGLPVMTRLWRPCWRSFA